MRKLFFLSVFLCIPILAGCASAGNGADSDEIKIVCTVFPEYEWTREIIGETENKSSITLLADNGTDFHSYQPSTEDIVTISTCDVLIYVGGESDKWIEDALKNSVNPDMQIVRLADILDDELLDEPETLEKEHEHEHDEELSVFDEHVWLSLKNAEKFCSVIAETLSDVDSENAAVYRTNAEEYTAKLSTLDSEFKEKLRFAKRNTVIFGDRFPFIYMMEDYGIDYYAAFPGCSSETDASFNTVLSLAKKTDEKGIFSILTIEGSDCNIADAIISNTVTESEKYILTLDSMQTVSRDEIEGGKTYLSVMEKNLDILMEALN